MKAKMLIVMSIFLLAVPFLFAEDVRKEISDEDFIEAWSGTWINTDYGGVCQKIINYPDRTAEGFGILTSTITLMKKKITILDKWLDSKGTIWYRGHCEFSRPSNFTSYEMGKISDSVNTWEYIWASEDYPIDEWEPDKVEYNYRIYYRQ